jgi:hypothetical protein
MMIEIIILILSVVFIVLPILGSEVGRKGMTYRESFLFGNGLALFLIICIIIGVVLALSFNHIVFDDISLSEAALKVYNTATL